MSEQENFWSELLMGSITDSAENVERIMQQQCADVKSATNGYIQARFIRLAFSTKKIENAWGLLEPINKMSADKTVRVEDTALDRADANSSYNPTKYAFDLYTSRFKFRVFTMQLGAIYPVEMELDDDIFDQTKGLYPLGIDISRERPSIFIHSDAELLDGLKIIISQNEKMKFIVQKLMRSERDAHQREDA